MTLKSNILILALFSFINLPSQTINTEDTRLLSAPAVSNDKIAFIYAEDLWTVNKDGSNPIRLTIDEGRESNPVFSPDGKQIAFSAEYEGNMDVYIVSVNGGIPKRLTWHPYPDIVRDFTPDGKSVLFISQRTVYTNRHTELFTVGIEGGQIEKTQVPNGFWASYSPDGQYIAYTPLADRFRQWKNYRGGTTSRIWIFNTKNHDITEIPKPDTGSNDASPVWVGEDVYFVSDRDGEFNLYSYGMSSKEVNKHTAYSDFPIIDLDATDSEIIFEQAGYLHTYDPKAKTESKLKIGIATDLLELRPRFVSGGQYIRSASVSPTAARVAMDFRGDIVTVPAEKGDVNNITNTVSVHEKYPSWSPDGKTIAYFSDEEGEYALHLYDQNMRSKTQKIKLNGAGFYAHPKWSPDSRKIAFVDNSRSLYVYDRDSNKISKVGSDALYTPGIFRQLVGGWSHDSNWLSYTLITATNFEQAHVYSTSENKSFEISDGYSNVTNVIFDPSGKYLYMFASTDAGPVVNWFDQSNQDMRSTNSIYLVTLQQAVPSPFFRENDVEIIEKEEEIEAKKEVDEKNLKETKVPALKIDFSGLQQRIIDLPLPSGNYHNLQVPKEGELYYLKFENNPDNVSSLKYYNLKDKEEKTLGEVGSFNIAAKGEKAVYEKNGEWGILTLGEKTELKPLPIDKIKVKIDPSKEFQNIFEEAWRVNRDYFYDPNMHGADWNAIKEKYQPFLKDVSSRSDLYNVMEWMFSELSVGHHRFSSRGDRMNNTHNIPGGLLGADLSIENDRYRITKIYGGLNLNKDLRSPLTEPGVTVNVNDYILEVNGQELVGTENLYKLFENSADRIITLTISPTTNIKDSRKESVTTIASERALRNRDWIESNMKKVHDATDGRVAYVYVPNTAGAGHEYFKRYFFPQADKDAIIIDERYNGGGQLADYYIDMLKKPEQAYWNFRYGNDLKSPSASIQGPKVMIIDETAGSGGDYLPWMFRKFKLGTIVGKRTWGGLVGVLGFPEFIDGGIVTAPNLAFYTKDGFRVENEGVAPDIEVEQTPKDVINGRDPQLEKAIEIILQKLEASPPNKMQRPDYPTRVRE